MMDIKLLDKLKQILTLAESEKNLGNTDAAENYMLMLQKMLLDHNLNIENINSHQKTEEKILLEKDAKVEEEWQDSLLNGISENNFCYALKTGNKYIVIGKDEDSHVVLHMFEFFKRALKDISEKSFVKYMNDKFEDILDWKKVFNPVQVNRHKKDFLKSYYLGAICGVISKMKEAREKEIQSKNNVKALVLAKGYELQKHINSKYGKTIEQKKDKIKDKDFFVQGYVDGRKISHFNGIEKGYDNPNQLKIN